MHVQLLLTRVLHDTSILQFILLLHHPQLSKPCDNFVLDCPVMHHSAVLIRQWPNKQENVASAPFKFNGHTSINVTQFTYQLQSHLNFLVMKRVNRAS